jgi:hypothetical protein
MGTDSHKAGGAMATYLSPGVYVEEVPAGARPIEGVGTAVAAFVGFATDGPFNTPTLVSNWEKFTETFGDFVEGGYLAHAVYGYFLNGGGNCYVVRVGGSGNDGNGAAGTGPQAVLGGYRVVARPVAKGRVTPELTVEVSDHAAPGGGEGQPPPEERFTLQVKRGGKVAETFEGLTTKRGKGNVVTVVREQSKLITIEEVPGTPWRCRSRPPGRRCPARSAPRSTSATWPSAAGSAGWRPSTRSPWWPRRTSCAPTSAAPSILRPSRRSSWPSSPTAS